MYDGHIYCEDYKQLKDTIVDILNGDDMTTNVHELESRIQELYDSGAMSSTQYDDLMSYIQDLI
jgi:hypothetical protein